MEAIHKPGLTRIVLTGSESTGKTTLAAQLAAHYNVEFVPEFVREYAAQKGEPVVMSDHGAIARGQMALENEYAARATSLLFQDADLLSTVAYYTHYSAVVRSGLSTKQSIVVPTCTSSHTSTHRGPPMAFATAATVARRCIRCLSDTLTRLNAPYVELSGLGEERLANATTIVDCVLKKDKIEILIFMKDILSYPERLRVPPRFSAWGKNFKRRSPCDTFF